MAFLTAAERRALRRDRMRWRRAHRIDGWPYTYGVTRSPLPAAHARRLRAALAYIARREFMRARGASLPTLRIDFTGRPVSTPAEWYAAPIAVYVIAGGVYQVARYF